MKKNEVNLTDRCLEIIEASQRPIDSVSVCNILNAGNVFKGRKYQNEDSKKKVISSLLSIHHRRGNIRCDHKEGIG